MECIVDLRVSGLDNTTAAIAWCIDTDNVTAIDTSGWTLTALGADEGRYTLSIPNATNGSTVEIYQIANRANYVISTLATVTTATYPIPSTSTATPITVSELIQAALETIGVQDPAEAMTAEDGNTGLRELNLLLDEISLDHGKMYLLTEDTHTLVIGTGSYTIGSGMTIDTTVPISIEQAFLRDTAQDPDADYPLLVNMTQAEYNVIQNKNQSNIPTALYYKQGYTGTIYFDFLPDKAYELHIFSHKAYTKIGAITDVLGLPVGYEAYIRAALANRLAPLYKKPVSDVAARIEAKMERMIDNRNLTPPPTWEDKSVTPTMNWSRR